MTVTNTGSKYEPNSHSEGFASEVSGTCSISAPESKSRKSASFGERGVCYLCGVSGISICLVLDRKFRFGGIGLPRS